MSIIEKAKERATQLTQQAKEKVDDIKETRRADALYAELGRIAFRQHTGRTEVTDVTRTTELVNELRTVEASAAAAAATGTGTRPDMPGSATFGGPSETSTMPTAGPVTTTGTGSVTTTHTGTPADDSHLPPPPTPG
jgi:hypothetical protein